MSELGTVKIADDVVKRIAAIAVEGVEGVYKLSGGVVDEVTRMFSKSNVSSGVKVEVGEKECRFEIYIIMKYGYKIPSVAAEVQKAVLNAVTDYTGLSVLDINVFVQGVKLEKEDSNPEPPVDDDDIDSNIDLENL